MKSKHPWFGCNAITTSHWFAILCAGVSGLLNCGCLVLSSNHVSIPIAPSETVEFRHEENGSDLIGWYVDHVHSPNLDYDISIRNNAERLQVGFLFWVLPIPFTESSVPYAEIKADLRPTTGTTLVNLWNIEYIPTNGMPVVPAKIFRQEDGAWKPVSPGQLSINKPESFTLLYNVPCNPDLPFKVSIGGISVVDQTNLTTIDYRQSKIIRTGFKLPY